MGDMDGPNRKGCLALDEWAPDRFLVSCGRGCAARDCQQWRSHYEYDSYDGYQYDSYNGRRDADESRYEYGDCKCTGFSREQRRRQRRLRRAVGN